VTEFDYRATKDGRLHLSWQGRTVKVVRGAAAVKLAAALAEADADGRQLLLAKATRNFRRGNER
jgi:hypothetical protein